jgi:hypothetical protein
LLFLKYIQDPDPHSFENLDPDPHSPKKLDPDPHKVNADLKHKSFLEAKKMTVTHQQERVLSGG